MTDISNKSAKEYQRIKKTLSLLNLFLTPVLLALLVFSGLSAWARDLLLNWFANSWALLAGFFTLFSLFFLIVELPLSFYSGFLIEHRFGLSNLNLAGWIRETAKRSLLSFAFSLVLLEGLYFLIRLQPAQWWLTAWVAYAAVSFVLGRLFPVFIVPLFYKYQPLADGELKDRILRLLAKYDLPAANLFSLNLSKTTKKANAAFMGLGKTKRVVLSDTLLQQFSPAEIEQVVAHELGHFKHHDIWKQLALGLGISFMCFAAGFYVMNQATSILNLNGVSDPAGLPLLMLVFLGIHYLTMPITNGFSRVCEYAADRFALDACRDRDVFISMMEKLGSINFADPDPAAWYEFLFYDHPSIKKRIAAAVLWSAS